MRRRRRGSFKVREWDLPDCSVSGAITHTWGESARAIFSSASRPAAWIPSSLVTRMVIGLPSRLPRGSSAIGSDMVEAPHIGAQRMRDAHAAIGLLVVLENGDHRAADGEGRSIEGVNIAGAARFGGWAIARLHAPRLEIAADRTRGDLPIGFLPRQPDFDVIGHLGRKT